LNTPDSDSAAAKPLVDLEQLQSACDGDPELMRELVDLYFGQADQIMAGLGKGIAAGDVGEVNHLSHKLAGSSLACGMSAIVHPLRQLEMNAKAGHLDGAPEWFAQAGAQLEAVRQFMNDHLQRTPPSA
jgi:HPt (histidine-containing phosphotransfer) domain-containing protein